MTRFRSSFVFSCLLLTGCAASYGAPVARIAEPDIAASYVPLRVRVHLGVDWDVGAAVVIAPGVAVTNAHNANLVDPKLVIGQVPDDDLLYFRVAGKSVPRIADPVVGEAVTAYGESTHGGLRIARGVVRQIHTCSGCSEPADFTFSNEARDAAEAGPGFSGGPVVDASGRLIGITFGYKDQGAKRLIYAREMRRVMDQFAALLKQPK